MTITTKTYKTMYINTQDENVEMNNTKIDTQPKVHDSTNSSQEYAVRRTGRHVGKFAKITYVLPCYSYAPVVDTVEPQKIIH